MLKLFLMWIQYMCWCLGCLFKQIHDKTVHIRLHWRDYFSLWQKVCQRVLLRPETFNIPHSQSIFFTRNLMILSVFENQGVICTWTFPRLVIHPLHWNKPKSVHSEREFLFMTVLVVVHKWGGLDVVQSLLDRWECLPVGRI